MLTVTWGAERDFQLHIEQLLIQLNAKVRFFKHTPPHLKNNHFFSLGKLPKAVTGFPARLMYSMWKAVLPTFMAGGRCASYGRAAV